MSRDKSNIIIFLSVLADSTRLEIMDFIRDKERTSSEIQIALKKTQSTISQHLKMLMNSNLVDSIKKDNINHYYIKNPDIFRLLQIIDSFVNKTHIQKLWDESQKDLEDVFL